MLFTDWLSQEMQKRSWSPAELARESGVTRGALSHIFTGTRRPGVSMLKAIARAFHLPAEDVFRAAGILEAAPDPDATPSLGEWIKMFRDADEGIRQHMLENARSLSDSQLRRKKI